MDCLQKKHFLIKISLQKKHNFLQKWRTWDSQNPLIRFNHLKRCENEKGVNLALPFDIPKTLHYINYLLLDRNVKANTCEKYLSGIRMHHLTMGFDAPALRPAIISLLLKGRENHDDIQAKLENKAKRIAVTVPVMKLLKRRIQKNGMVREQETTCLGCLLYLLEWIFSHPGNVKQETK